jgi:hypothetical protein
MTHRMTTPKPAAPDALSQLARRVLLEARPGADVRLPSAGSALENPHVYDAVARELLRAAESGRLRVVEHDTVGGLVRRLVFRRQD